MNEFNLKKYYTIDAGLLVNANGNNEVIFDYNINLNILLENELSFTPQLFNAISTLNNNFVISLSSKFSNETSLQTILPKLYLLICLYPSIMLNNNIIIPIINDQLLDNLVNTSLISQYFKNQGNYNLAFPTFIINNSLKNIQQADNCIFIIESNQLPLKDTLKIELSTLVFIYFFEKINTIRAFKEKINTIVLKSLPVFVSKNDFSTYYIDKNVLESEISLWKKRVELYQSFLVLSKTVQEKEYYDVIDWYHKEYEALPKWYKRVGHLIKVCLGKRSFKSLFNNTK